MFAVASVVEDYRASVANTPRKRGRLSPENVAKGPLAAAAARHATARAPTPTSSARLPSFAATG